MMRMSKNDLTEKVTRDALDWVDIPIWIGLDWILRELNNRILRRIVSRISGIGCEFMRIYGVLSRKLKLFGRDLTIQIQSKTNSSRIGIQMQIDWILRGLSGARDDWDCR